MARKTVFTAILVAFILFFQYGCKTTEATQASEDNDQVQVAAEETQQQAEEPAINVANLVVTTSDISEETPAKSPADNGDFSIRVNCGYFDGDYTDKAGHVWLPDQEKTDDNTWGAIYGSTIERPDLGIEGTDCPLIYESERYSMDGYEFDVPAGKYDVILHYE